MRSVAIFDIDGTIFRSSLTIELLKKLVLGRIFPSRIMTKVAKSEKKWLNRAGHYEQYVRDVAEAYQQAIVGKKRSAIAAASRQVVAGQKFRTYRYTRALLEKIRGKYFTMGISGSPLEIVSEYNKFLRFDKVYGWEFGVGRDGRYTDVVLHEPPKYKKEIAVRYVQSRNLSFLGSIGVGDTESDIGFLDLVENPVCFNPNRALARTARKHNWPIIVERKDLIVEFKPKNVKFLSGHRRTPT